MTRFLTSLLALGLLLPTASANADPIKIDLWGFVDTSLTYSFMPEGVRDANGVSLGLDQAEIDVIVALAPGLTLRTDLNWFPGAGAASFGGIVEQAFAEWYPAGHDKGFFLRAGKWNAPIGFETIDPTGLYQFSQGLLFSFATPANLNGFAFGWHAHEFKAQLWLTNDWDVDKTPKDASVGGRLDVPLGDTGTVGLSTTYGAIQDSDLAVFMVDVDAALTFDALTIGAQVNFGLQDEAQSLGFLLMGSYAVNDMLGATLRFDYLDREFGTVYKGMSITAAAMIGLVQAERDGSKTTALALIPELRFDLPDGGDTVGTFALELLASF